MFDVMKLVQTVDGREVRIYATDGHSDYPIHGAIKTENEWHPESWTLNGKFFLNSDGSYLDLVNPIPKKRKVSGWMNVYQDKLYISHPTHGEADANATDGRIACFPFEYTEGDGLEP